MSRETKLALGIVAGVLLLCLCIGGVTVIGFGWFGQKAVQSMTDSPAEVAEIAGDIVDYELPAGYQARFGMSLLGLKMAAFGSSEIESQMIMLMQFPENFGGNQAEMEEQMRQALERQTGRRNGNMQTIDQIAVTIRDQEVILTVSEGNGLRQMTGVFQGKEGLVMLMISGLIQEWDQAAIDAFIASLR
jgi:hypothetical protein